MSKSVDRRWATTLTAVRKVAARDGSSVTDVIEEAIKAYDASKHKPLEQEPFTVDLGERRPGAAYVPETRQYPWVDITVTSPQALRLLLAKDAEKADHPKPKAKEVKVEDIIYLKMDQAVVRQFKALCAEQGRQQKHLAAEALNWLFRQYGKSPIADEGPKK